MTKRVSRLPGKLRQLAGGSSWRRPASKPAVSALVGAAILTASAASLRAEDAGPVGVSGHWTPVFTEEFDGDVLDRSKWTTCFWWDDHGCTNLAGQEMSWYLPENVKVGGGSLHLIARKQAVRGYKGWTFPYTSGMVTSGRDFVDRAKPSRFDMTYGYVEIRAKLPRGRGLWPALWLLPSTQEPLPEIDIMEMLGHAPNTLQMHFHYREANGEAVDPGHAATTVDLSAGWHVYGLKWTPDALVWYLDGAEMWRFENAAAIPREPMYLLINLAVGGKWPGKPSSKTVFPAEMLVDYVKAWRSAQ